MGNNQSREIPFLCSLIFLLLFSCGFPSIVSSYEIPPAKRFMDEGLKFFQKGNFERAILNYEEAERLFDEKDASIEHLDALIQLSLSYQSLGQYEKALMTLDNALSLTKASDYRIQKAKVLNVLGNVYLSTGRFDKAESYLREGLSIAEKEDNPELPAAGLNNLGNLYAIQQKYPDAIAAYKESISYGEKSGNKQLVSRTLANYARAYLQDKKYNEAEKLLDTALKKHTGLINSHDKAYGLVNIGRSYQRIISEQPGSSGDLSLHAYTAFNEAVKTAQAIEDHRSASYALGYLGQLYEYEKRHQEALKLSRMAVFKSQQAGSHESIYLWQWQTGRILKALGEIDNAVVAYRQTVHSLQNIRQGGASIDCEMCNGTSFRESIKPIFFELSDLLLQQAKGLEDKDKIQSYLVQVRETVELLKTAEIRDYFKDDCVDAYQAKITSLDTIADDTAVVYIIPFPDRLELLLSFSTGIERFTVNVGSEEFTDEVRLFRKRLEKRTTRQYMAHAQKLYDWVIRPIEKKLVYREVRTLIFVPDGSLRTVPMSALHDGNQFLIKKFAVATTMGLTLTDPQPIQREGMDIFLAGLSESVQGFPPLGYVSAELDGIQDLYSGTMIKDQQFLIPEMERELEETPFSAVHIASHGEFSGDVNNSFLLTWDGKLTMDNLDSFMSVSRFRKNPVDLLTLSACQTAAGDDRAALGLAGIAIKAGARSALATLWYVNDEASSRLVVEFYKQLKDKSNSKAEALQRAQLQLVNDRRYQHPSYWSPFLMIGNWL
jgi:CHAT domain-containing protein/Tfp pilus assembly protein PilF